MSDMSQRFLEVALSSNLRAVVLIALAYLVLRWCGATVSAPRHDLWLAALLGCLVMPLLTLVLPVVPLPFLPANELAVRLEVQAAVPGGPALPIAVDTAARTPLSLHNTLLLIYVSGFALVLLRYGLSVLRLEQHARTMATWSDSAALTMLETLRSDLGIARRITLLGSDRITSPHTWGLSRPRIALPLEAKAWPADRLRNALLHELCHVKRCDWALLLLQQVVAAIYWFNPVIHFAIRQSEFEAERACDDCVIGAGGNSADYAEQLVDLMASSRRPRLAGIALGGGHFAGRVRAILDPSKERRQMNAFKRCTAAFGAVLSIFAVAAFDLTHAQPADSAPPDEPAAASRGAELDVARATLDNEIDLHRDQLAALQRRRQSFAVQLQEFQEQAAAERQAVVENAQPEPTADTVELQLRALDRDYQIISARLAALFRSSERLQAREQAEAQAGPQAVVESARPTRSGLSAAEEATVERDIAVREAAIREMELRIATQQAALAALQAQLQLQHRDLERLRAAAEARLRRRRAGDESDDE